MSNVAAWERLPRTRAFTLVELLVVLAVSVVIFAIGIPSVRSFMLNNRRAATVNGLATALNLARSEALKRAQTVTVCRVADPDANLPACPSGTWASGWVVFVDADNGDDIDAGEDILRRNPGAGGGVTLTSSRNALGRVEFNNLGASQGFNQTFAYCDSRGVDNGRNLVVSNQGRIEIRDATTCGFP